MVVTTYTKYINLFIDAIIPNSTICIFSVALTPFRKMKYNHIVAKTGAEGGLH